LLVTGRARLDALPEPEQVELGETDAATLGGLLMERLGRPAVVGDSIVLPARPGYLVSSNSELGGTGSNGHSAAHPPLPAEPAGTEVAARSLRVTALKVLRTRIQLMKVEAVEPARAEPAHD
jgi:CBS domain containing-hemolysin-like protein